MIYTNYYISVTGSYTIQDSLLINAKIIRVCREGVGYLPAALPVNREFSFDKTTGKITFVVPFIIVDVGPYDKRERVMVKYKY